jgi:hypothetical protein
MTTPAHRILPSAWIGSALLLAISAVAAFPRTFLPGAAHAPPRGEYGLSVAEVAVIGLLGLLAILSVGLLLYAAIRSAVQPSFRRSGLLLACVVIGNALAWVIAMVVLGNR